MTTTPSSVYVGDGPSILEKTETVECDRTIDEQLMEQDDTITSRQDSDKLNEGRRGPDETTPTKNTSSPCESSTAKSKSSNSGRKSNECDLCGKVFPHKLGLTYHMNTHLGYKPFECPECGRAFSQKGNMNQHMVTHTGRKDFRCPVCHQLFAQRQSCREHVRGHHKMDPTAFHFAEYRNPDSEKYKNSPKKP